MAFNPVLSPIQKALEINLDDTIYGSFAEIGAGQEVVRNFFRAGAAAGTIARALSAYDMTISDTIYGKSPDGRYVSRGRLRQMIDCEYDLVVQTLESKRPPGTKFFAFGDTVSAKSYKGTKPCHGWLGVKFQHAVKAKPSRIIIHINMFDTQNITQQEAVGILGTNLVHACFNYAHDHAKFVKSLMDNLTRDSIEIDMIEIDGNAFCGIDSRIFNLELVKQGITDVTMFDAQGQILQAADVLYKKHILLLRGSFRPPTYINFDMLESSVKEFTDYIVKTYGEKEKENIIILAEISMHSLRSNGVVDNHDFLERVDILSALNQRVMITNYDNFYSLNNYLMKSTNREIAFVLGIPGVREILDESRYVNMNTGLLGALGLMFGNMTRVFVYPTFDEESKKVLTVKTLQVPEHLKHLKEYLLENRYFQDLEKYNPEYQHIYSRKVLHMIQEDDTGWEQYVPPVVADIIKSRNLFKRTWNTPEM